MVKNYKYYGIAATEEFTECLWTMSHKVTITKLRNASYEVIATVIVSIGKALA